MIEETGLGRYARGGEVALARDGCFTSCPRSNTRDLLESLQCNMKRERIGTGSMKKGRILLKEMYTLSARRNCHSSKLLSNVAN
jgi:hypothetical protein